MARLRCVGFNPLRRFITNLAQTSSIEWHRALFLQFVELVRNRTNEARQQQSQSGTGNNKRRKTQQLSKPVLGEHSTSLLAFSQYLATPKAQFKLLANLILPCLQHALEKAPQQLLSRGKPPRPSQTDGKVLVNILGKQCLGNFPQLIHLMCSFHCKEESSSLRKIGSVV